MYSLFFLVTGSISFLVSDTVLAYYNTVKTMTKYPLALVMSTYVIAQGGIILGCINLR
ncbi:lysoplasmalogenase family protein [Treponema primitia]|uniref:lysoplasmalogenase family protein n=1 Tax=Treponema primitia TaxID=88058 RepID=UPI000300A0F9